MGSLGVHNFGSELLVSASAVVAIGVAGFLAAFMSRKTAAIFIWASRRWAQRGLSARAKSYLSDWLISWESDTRTDSQARMGSLAAEAFLLLRVITLPLHLKAIRRQAVNAGARERAQAANSLSRGYYGSVRHAWGSAYFEMDREFRQLDMAFSDGYNLFVEVPENLSKDERVTLLLQIKNYLSDLQPRQRSRAAKHLIGVHSLSIYTGLSQPAIK